MTSFAAAALHAMQARQALQFQPPALRRAAERVAVDKTTEQDAYAAGADSPLGAKNPHPKDDPRHFAWARGRRDSLRGIGR